MRIARRLLQIALLLVTLVVSVMGAALIVTQTAWFRDWLRGLAERQADKYLNGHLTIGALRGNLLSGVELGDLRIEVDGRPAISIQGLDVRYDLSQLLSGRIALGRIVLEHPVIRIEREGGRLNLAQLLRPRPASQKGKSNLTVSVGEISIANGSIALPARPVGTAGEERGGTQLPQQIDNLNLRLSYVHGPTGDTARIAHLSFHGTEPAFDLADLSGEIAVSDGTLAVRGLSIRTALSAVRVNGLVRSLSNNPLLDLHVDCGPADLTEVGLLIPSVARYHLRPELHADLAGPVSAMRIDFAVRGGAAGITGGKLVLDAPAADHHLSGVVSLRDFDIYRIFPSSLHTDVTGVAHIDIGFVKAVKGTDVHGTYHLQAPYAEGFGYRGRDLEARGRIDATQFMVNARTIGYGSPVTADGVIQLPHDGLPVRYELRGHATSVDLRALPRSMKLPAVPSDLTFDYHVAGVASKVQASGDFDRSMLIGATIQPGFSGAISYQGEGSDLGYTATGQVSGFDLQRFGREFDIDALKGDRFSSSINADFRLSASGTSLAALALGATGVARDSKFVGATFTDTDFDVRFIDHGLTAKSRGRVGELDPARAIDGMPKGQLAGQFDIALGFRRLGDRDEALPLADNLSISGHVALQSSSLNGVDITQATIDGRYAAREGDLRQLEVTGPALHLTASGPIALDDRGQSRVKYHAETTTLDRIGRLFGVSMWGAATADGTLTGNATNLQTSGTLTASNVGYQAWQALDVDGQYAVQLPGLSFDKAIASADAKMTFATFAGLHINEITGRTSYQNGALAFDIQAREPQRELNIAGDAIVGGRPSTELRAGPSETEVRFRRLALQSGRARWEMAAGSQPRIEFGADRIGVEDFALVSGAQRISASGTIGDRSSNLDVRVSRLDMSNIDALTLTDHQFGGVLDGEAIFTGPRGSLQGNSKFSVTRGSFGRFAYQSLGGSLRWERGRLSVDARLQESPRAWIAVNGSVPDAMFQPTLTAEAAKAPVDLRITSAPLDLGVVQAFTTAVRDVTGTLAVDARIGGTAANPEAAGDLIISNAALLVVPTDVRYKNIGAHVVLHPGGLTVKSFTAYDPNGKMLEVSGDLALGQRQVSGLNLRIQAGAFEVISNDLADVALNLDLKAEGELRQPHISGTVSVSDGTLNVDNIMNLALSSPYSTSAETVPTATTPVLKPEVTTALGGATLDLRVRMPNGLVAKSSDLRFGRTSIGFGQVNVALSGEVRVEKTTEAGTRLTGNVQTIRGTYQFQGRRFDITSGGQVRFEGTPRVNPALDITATRLISGIETRVHIGGRLRQPELTLASNPPLDQTDILSLVVFGQPSNQLESGQQLSLAERAATIGSALVASTVARQVANALRLDTFEIETVQNAGQMGAILTVGEQLGARLYVNVRRGVGPDTTMEFVVDYQLTDFLRFETTMSQASSPTRMVFRQNQSGADLIFMFSF